MKKILGGNPIEKLGAITEFIDEGRKGYLSRKDLEYFYKRFFDFIASNNLNESISQTNKDRLAEKTVLRFTSDKGLSIGDKGANYDNWIMWHLGM